ncbi:MAG: LysM peptidoglycan-binding domain-containing protein [Verrucomicrobiaceae bacterium]|nr:MAG: LysM peptidoglycan-binding domain-containing protein [Verrucomicrobiaceae bacterium]
MEARGMLKETLIFLDPNFHFWDFAPAMKVSFRHLAWMWVLLCCDASGQTTSYTVKPGDSLSKIARTQGCTVDALAKANGMKLSAVIQPGQKLKLPSKPGAAPATSNASAANGVHIIQPGDTFAGISRQYGVSLESLLAANPGVNPKALKPGQKVQLATAPKPPAPKPASPSEPAPTPAASPPATPPTVESPAAPETAPAESPPANGGVRTVMVDAETTFGEFAAKHGTDIQRLNELNGLDLTSATVLAKGSELYVPAQP